MRWIDTAQQLGKDKPPGDSMVLAPTSTVDLVKVKGLFLDALGMARSD